jgi:hypothetical protein
MFRQSYKRSVGTYSQAQVDPTGGGGVIVQTGFQHVMAKALFI